MSWNSHSLVVNAGLRMIKRHEKPFGNHFDQLRPANNYLASLWFRSSFSREDLNKIISEIVPLIFYYTIKSLISNFTVPTYSNTLPNGYYISNGVIKAIPKSDTVFDFRTNLHAIISTKLQCLRQQNASIAFLCALLAMLSFDFKITQHAATSLSVNVCRRDIANRYWKSYYSSIRMVLHFHATNHDQRYLFVCVHKHCGDKPE